MDYYFSKFKRTIVPRKTQVTGAMQLAKFQDCWNDVHNILMVEDRKANMHVKQTDIPERLQQMTDMLVDEEARQDDDATGACMEYGDCMEYLLKNQLLRRLVTVSEKSDQPVGIRGELIRTIANMVDLLGYWFLEHKEVHGPTIKLLRFCVIDQGQSDIYHEDLVDLMYTICSKIHGRPALLNIFFHDKRWLTTPQKTRQSHVESTLRALEAGSSTPFSPTAGKEPDYEFLLFSYLLRFVHREGRTGDYARTGLLFIVEMATNQLGDFILESDFAMTMGAGLCALYSQLPRKLVIKNDAEINANFASYLLGQELSPKKPPSETGAELSSSPDFRYQLDSFLKLFEFCQDVLIRCPNTEISARLLQSIRTPFLEKILYPTIEECSDRDGSSVAVISYLDLILQILQHDELSDLVVGFLMDDGDDMHSNFGRFTLKDLIFYRLKHSKSQPTVIATLKLLRTLITRHCRYSLKLLNVSTNEEDKGPLTTVSHHHREIELYFSLIARVDDEKADNVLSFGYEDYLQDVETHMERDICFQTMSGGYNGQDAPQGTQTPKSERRRSFKYGQRFDDQKEIMHTGRCYMPSPSMRKHRIKTNDTLMQTLLDLLNPFFAQSPELNLALTGVISAIAICPYRSLEGWVTFRESDRTTPDDVLILNGRGDPTISYTNGKDINNNGGDNGSIRANDIYARYDTSPVNEDDEDDDRSVDYGAELNSAKVTSRTQFKSYPPFFTLFQMLTQQIDCYRSEVDGFDQLLEQRRNGLMVGNTEPVPLSMMQSTSTSTRRGSLFPDASSPPHPTISSPTNNRRASVMMRPSPTPSKSSATYFSAPMPGLSGTGAAPHNPIIANPLSPLAIHARKTQNIRIQPLFSSRFVFDEEPIYSLDPEDEDTFAPKAVNPSQTRRMDKSTEISLSMLLNNVVILEETIKELVAIMQVRRSLGIDEIRFA
ncbi:Retinoic acid induced 16-like protein-domain-containing protein [Dichotomocladium elegans]|nr:Retinoic acid induced 16-like protein-domain-containing protein [Dichotomocladium elegans]